MTIKLKSVLLYEQTPERKKHQTKNKICLDLKKQNKKKHLQV